jgi:micrococcal nuclease
VAGIGIEVNQSFSRFLSVFFVRVVARTARRRPVAAAAAALVLGGAVVLASGSNVNAQSDYAFNLTGRVVQVSDGDTFNMLVNGRTQRIRMASIDAPELGKGSEQPGQPFGRASREALADLIAGQTLTVRCFERDRYERAICDVPLGDGETVNQRMVQQGMAWANTEKRGSFLRDDAVVGLQKQAQSRRAGLWSEPDPVQPWAWRYHCWRQQRC